MEVSSLTKNCDETLQDIAFGSLAGFIGKVVEFPFDTVKVRLQSQPANRLPLYAGPLDCLRQSVRHDGLRSLYRGVSAPLAGAAAETACLFWSYRVAQDVLRSAMMTVPSPAVANPLPLGALVAAGAMSGAVTSLLLTPIELVKCRVQAPSAAAAAASAALPGPFAVVADVYRREGVAGFWRGQLGTFVRETGGTAAWFGSYEAVTLFFRRRARASTTADATPTGPVSVPQQLAAGAVAGMSYNFLFYPADTIKSQMQTGAPTTGAHRETFTGVARALYRAHGWTGLYRGCGITVARSAPSSALIFTIVENLKAAWG